MKQLLFNSSLFKFLEAIVGIAASLLLTPYLIGALGAEQYGLWVLVMSILGWFSLMTLGLPWAVQRNIAIYLARNETDNVNKTFSCGFVLFFLLGIAAVIVVVLLALNTEVFNVADENQLAGVLLALTIKVFWDCLFNAFFGFYSGLYRFDVDAKLTTICSLLQTALMFALVKPLGIKGAIIATLASDLVLRVSQFYSVKKLYPALRFSFDLIDRKEILQLAHFSKYVIAMDLARLVFTRSEATLATQLFNLQTVTLYSIPARLCAHVAALTTSIIHVFFPVFSRKHATNEDVVGVFFSVVRINLFICCTLYLPLIVLSSSFIRLWIGDEFVTSPLIVIGLVFALVCQAVAQPVQDLLFAQENHKLFPVINLTGAGLFLLSTIMLAKAIGLPGIALGMAFSSFVANFVLHLWLMKRYNAIKLSKVVWIFVLTLPVLFVLGPLGNLVLSGLNVGWAGLIAAAVVVTLVSTTLAWFVILDGELRGNTLKIVGNIPAIDAVLRNLKLKSSG